MIRPLGTREIALEDGAPEASEPSIQSLCRALLETIGDDPSREALVSTPRRYEECMRELTSGYSLSPAKVVEGAVFEDSSSQMVLVKRIDFYSLCEHHLLPFFGRAHIAYLPNGKILGLSKIPQLLNVFARRLQIQERLTEEVAEAIEETIAPRGVACLLEARHLCMMMRGPQAHSGVMTTSAMRGEFETDANLRAEFFRLVSSDPQI